MAQPLQVESPSVDTAEAPYFVDLVRDAARRSATTRQDLNTQNLSIYTTLDLHAADPGPAGPRRRAWRAVREDDPRKRKDRRRCRAASSPSSRRTGRGRGAGGRPLLRRRASTTASPRPAGSPAAPSSPSSTWPPSRPPSTIPRCRPSPRPPSSRTRPPSSSTRTRSTCPQNYEDKYLGYVTLRKALAHSLNVATVKVAEMVGYERVAACGRSKLGIGAHDQALSRPWPSAPSRPRPLEMATAYNVLANDGLKVEPITVLRVTDDKGTSSSSTAPQRRRASSTRSRPSWSPT